MRLESVIGHRERTGSVVEPGCDIRDAIRNAIVDHRLPPGTKLSEDEVGEVFGVSRTVVRSALQALSHLGLVTLQRNRGAYVARPSAEEAQQVFAARLMIEPELARMAAARCTRIQARLLRAHTEDEAAALGGGDRRTAIHLSGGLHIKIAEIAGNEVMTRFLTELVARSSLIISLYGRTGVSACGLHEHRDLISALSQRDADASATIMTEHLRHIDHDLDVTRGPAPPRALADLLGL